MTASKFAFRPAGVLAGLFAATIARRTSTIPAGVPQGNGLLVGPRTAQHGGDHE